MRGGPTPNSSMKKFPLLLFWFNVTVVGSFIRPYSDRGGYLVDGIKVVLLNKGGKFGSRHTDFHVYAGGSFITCLVYAKEVDMKPPEFDTPTDANGQGVIVDLNQNKMAD